MRAIGEVEFFERWEKQHAEWLDIAERLGARAKACGLEPPCAWDVSHEQRARAMRDGRKLVIATADGFYEITPGEDREISESLNA